MNCPPTVLGAVGAAGKEAAPGPGCDLPPPSMAQPQAPLSLAPALPPGGPLLLALPGLDRQGAHPRTCSPDEDEAQVGCPPAFRGTVSEERNKNLEMGLIQKARAQH